MHRNLRSCAIDKSSLCVVLRELYSESLKVIYIDHVCALRVHYIDNRFNYTGNKERSISTMDYDKLKKSAHVKEHIWRQHLNWMEVVGKQADENIRQRQKQINNGSVSPPQR
jgi:hypothetical protein